MKYRSTRASAEPVGPTAALERGIAPDGGLYVPCEWPAFAPADFESAADLAEIAHILLLPFFAGDPLESDLGAICRAAFDFPIVLKGIGGDTWVLELFHGPTAAFKDFGARFLAECMWRSSAREGKPLTILVATSGDTGGAVAAAFHDKPGVEVFILFPSGMVSPRQELQLTTWGGNITALAVEGDFDACQRLAKGAMADLDLRRSRRLSSANSINLGRLLPQMAYYAWASTEHLRRCGSPARFVIPSGNLGNATAAFWAKRIGLPIGEIVLATNANRAVTAFLDGAAWRGRATVPTLASAMDVGSPSNMERLFDLFGGEPGARAALRAVRVLDEEIRREIAAGRSEWGEVWDPHTATAIAARRALAGEWIAVATAHPAKFEQVVEPLVRRPIDVPASLARLVGRPSRAVTLRPDPGALKEVLLSR